MYLTYYYESLMRREQLLAFIVNLSSPQLSISTATTTSNFIYQYNAITTTLYESPE